MGNRFVHSLFIDENYQKQKKNAFFPTEIHWDILGWHTWIREAFPRKPGPHYFILIIFNIVTIVTISSFLKS